MYNEFEESGEKSERKMLFKKCGQEGKEGASAARPL